MSFSMIGKSTSWTVPAMTAGAIGSRRMYGAAFGSATGPAAAAAAAAGAGVASPMPGIGDAGAAAAGAVAAGAAVAAERLATVWPPPGVPAPV